MKKILIVLALMATTSPLIQAQQAPHCGSDEFEAELFAQDPQAAAETQAARQAIFANISPDDPLKKSSATVYTIPVVVHVIYNSYEDNIAKEQILDALAVLNEDFRRINSDTGSTRPIFKGVAADVEVEFTLAKLDPQGNCTDGIVRVQSPLSVNARNNVKPLSHWNNGKYLNIWVVNSIQGSGGGTTLGYAYKPRYNQDYKTDGVVIRHDMMGRIGTATGIGRTLTHEVGHYLGLDHPFYDNPQDPNDDGCTTGDGISDTPPVSSASFGCNLNRNSCNNDSPDLPDMIENYMDYADDQCTNLFTAGQRAVMRSSLETPGLRQSLREEYNLIATGVKNLSVCAPQAQFTTAQQVICPNTTVQFRDLSAEGTPDSYQWSFPGGQPATSTAANPSVTYDYSGVYSVSLTVSNSVGTTTYTDSNYVVVKDYWNDNSAVWIEDFESGSVQAPEINITSQFEPQRFEVTNQAASSGSNSLTLGNAAVSLSGEKDAFISPLIYTHFGYGMNLFFDYAFARKSNNDQDQLSIYASSDCGQTWEIRRVLSGSSLSTVSGTRSAPFTPSSSADWKNASLPFDFYRDRGPILIKFEFSSGGGNNLYIDNIRFAAVNIGLEEKPLEQSLSVYPNPSNGQFTIDFGRSLEQEARLELHDLSGRMVQQVVLQKGTQSHQFYGHQLAAGVYLLKIESGAERMSRKLIVR